MADDGIVLSEDAYGRVSDATRWVERARHGPAIPHPIIGGYGDECFVRVTGTPTLFVPPLPSNESVSPPADPAAFRLWPGNIVIPDLSTGPETWTVKEACRVVEINRMTLVQNMRYRGRIYSSVKDGSFDYPLVTVDVGDVPRYFVVNGRSGVEGNRTYTMSEMMMTYNPSGASIWQLLPGGIVVGPTATPPSFARMDVFWEVGDAGYKYDPTGKIVAAVPNRRPKPNATDPDQWDILQVLTVSMVSLVTVASCQANETLLSRTRKFACPGGIFVDEPPA